MPKDSPTIRTFAHCRHCAPQKPVSQSPSEWARLDAGLTETGFEVWCKRCRMVVVHLTPEALREFLDRPPRCECCPGGEHAKDYPPTAN